MVVAIVIVVLIAGSLLFHFLSPWYFTPIASNWTTIDDTVHITFWVTGVVFVVVNLFMAYAVVKFRYRREARAQYEPENKKLEWWLLGLTTVGVARRRVAPRIAEPRKHRVAHRRMHRRRRIVIEIDRSRLHVPHDGTSPPWQHCTAVHGTNCCTPRRPLRAVRLLVRLGRASDGSRATGGRGGAVDARGAGGRARRTACNEARVEHCAAQRAAAFASTRAHR